MWSDHELYRLIRSREAAGLRVRARISQETMAAGLGVSPWTLFRLENGRHRPHLALAGRYARVLRGLANHEAAAP